MTTAPLMLLENSAQAADIRGSRAPSDVIKGTYRIKSYLKQDHWDRLVLGNNCGIGGCGVRGLLFDQPYQVASDRTGLDWNITNRAFMGQVAACNLRCDYCYVDSNGFLGGDRKPEIVEVSSEQYVNDFMEHMQDTAKATGKIPAGLLRYSGGEPFMFQDWLADSLDYAVQEACLLELPDDGTTVVNNYCWVDTNLTIQPTLKLLNVLKDGFIGVCGCFKPDQRDVDDQLMIVKALVDAGVDLYLYFPSNGSAVDLRIALDGLSEIHPNLPLRLNVIEIRWGYSAMQDRREMVSAEDAVQAYHMGRSIWGKYVGEHCDQAMLHLPSHQIPIH